MKRILAAGSVVLLAALSAGHASDAKSDVKEIRIIESGGTSGESIDIAYGAPFTEATGVRLVREQPPSLGKLKAMVKSGNVTADLMELSGPGVETARAQGLIEDLDWDLIDPQDMNEEARLPYAFGYQYFALFLASMPDAKPVNSWQEFWDTERQPGRRAIPAYARYALPLALLADGVKPDELYPLDIDRALASIDRIKDDLILWEAASQTPQLLKSKEAVYVATWDNVFEEDGFFVNFAPGIWDVAYFVMPKGAPNPELAMKLLHEMSKVENQARAAEITPVAGPSPTIMDHISPAIQAKMPTNPELRKTQAGSDRMWWAEHGDEAERRWSEYMLKNF